MAAFFDLLPQLFQDVETVVYIDQADLPLALDLPMVLLDFPPLSECPLRQSGHNAIDLEEGVRTALGVAVLAGGDTIGGALIAEASEAYLLVVG